MYDVYDCLKTDSFLSDLSPLTSNPCTSHVAPYGFNTASRLHSGRTGEMPTEWIDVIVVRHDLYVMGRGMANCVKLSSEDCGFVALYKQN